MQSKGDLMRAVIAFCHASDADEAKTARKLINSLLDSPVGAVGPTSVDVDPVAKIALEGRQFPLKDMSDSFLSDINMMLPWGAMTTDQQGRVLGSQWSANKRRRVQPLIDPRLAAFDERYSLKGKHVLEVGCFEGIHTIGCKLLGADVTAVDSRVENILKTLVRLWAYGFTANVVPWNLEDDGVPAGVPDQWDILHHIGVLYHQTNPAESLALLADRTRKAIILDTHVARDEEIATESYQALGRTFKYQYYGERPISPFAGMLDHAKWLLTADLEQIMVDRGFTISRTDVREESNGTRVMIWAHR